MRTNEKNNEQENVSTMNEKNYQFLNDQLKYTGFGENMNDLLKEKMQMGLQGFTLFHDASFGKDHTAAVLHFKESMDSDMYFFNRYDLSLKNDLLPQALKQTFYITAKGDNVTLKGILRFTRTGGSLHYKQEDIEKLLEKGLNQPVKEWGPE